MFDIFLTFAQRRREVAIISSLTHLETLIKYSFKTFTSFRTFFPRKLLMENATAH